MIRIIIADDHPLIREGLKKIIQSESGFELIAEASDGIELLDKVRKLHPDVVVLDLQMPRKSGLEVLEDLKSEYPKLPILIMSIHPEDTVAVRTFQTGASGYITKNRVSEELLIAIRRVAQGRRYISMELGEKLAESIDARTEKKPHELLSNREFQVLRLIGMGKSTRQIAQEISLSPATVTTYRARLLEKMNMKTNAELIHYAIRNGLVD